jgi:hypothetical protein
MGCFQSSKVFIDMATLLGMEWQTTRSNHLSSSVFLHFCDNLLFGILALLGSNPSPTWFQ